MNYSDQIPFVPPDLVNNPELANDSAIAAQLLVRFLSDREDAIRHAITSKNLAAARKLVNGGSLGLDRFTDAYTIGSSLIADS